MLRDAPRLLVVIAALGACRDLPYLPADTCGNGAVERGEDCDSRIDPALGSGTACAAAGEIGQCRYTCSAAQCPAGWGCGADGICRAGTASWASLPSEIELTASAWGAGDLDGDHAPELVAVTSTGVAVVDGLGAQVRITPLGAPTAAAVIQDLDGDGAIDVVVPEALGLVVVFGGGTDLVPSAYAPFSVSAADTWLVPVRIPDVSPEHGVLSIAGTANPISARITRIPEAQINSGDWPIDMPGFGGDRLAVIDVDDSGTDEVVVAGGGEARILSVHRDPIQPQLYAVFAADIHAVNAVGGALAADVDGDGDLDVLVRLDHEEVGVARDTGTTLADAVTEPRFSVLAQPGAAVPNTPEVLQAWPLAAGDLDGDGIADYVSPNAVFVAKGAQLERAFARPTGEPWTDAVIVDWDGDGVEDIAAAGTSSIVLMRNGGGSQVTFAPQVIPTPCAPSLLRAADLDCDGIGDIVYRASGPGCPRPYLGVVYGGHGPRAATAIAALDVARYEVGRFRDSRGVFDCADDLVAVADRGALPFRPLAFVIGSADRHPLAPLALSPTAGRNDVADAVVAGRFGAKDLAAFVGGSAPRLYLAASSAQADPRPAPFEWRSLGLAAVDPRCSRWLAGDLDGDGVDELVGVPLACAAVPMLTVIDVSGPVPRPRTYPFAIVEDAVLADLDGDHRADLITVGAASSIAWSGDPADRTELPAATSAALVQADRDAQRELALLAGDTIVIVDVDGRAATVKSTQPLATTGTRLLVTDLDRDGLDDLVVTRPDGARIYRGVEAQP